MSEPMKPVRVHKSCDECKRRKVRCLKVESADATACTNCLRHNVKCHFSVARKPRRGKNLRWENENNSTAGSSGGRRASVTEGSVEDESKASVDFSYDSSDERNSMRKPRYDGLQELYIDRLLAASPEDPLANRMSKMSLQGPSFYGNEFSLTFFSESRLKSLAARLGHTKANELVESVAQLVSQRMKAVERVPSPPSEAERTSVLGVDKSLIAASINAYFEQVHPLYPFLDRRNFEERAFGPELAQLLTSDKPWSALYYTVLALGSQYNDGGSFQPKDNIAWKFFFTALALFSDLIIGRTTLTTIQAITAMAIFADNISSMQFQFVMLSEGAKKAQALGYNKLSGNADDPRNRAFWILYSLEKRLCFFTGRTSVLRDSDISCPIPSTPEPSLDNFDWTLAQARHSRLLSRMWSSLYSVSASGKSADYYRSTLDQVLEELEDWRLSMPIALRPSESIKLHARLGSRGTLVCLMASYLYYNTVLAMKRTILQLEVDAKASNQEADDSETRRESSMSGIMSAARSSLEMTKYIEVEPYTPLWILAGLPLSCLFVLFDLVVHNPTHPETQSNLAFLDIASGHFSRLEYATNGTVPGSIASEFAHVARAYIQETNRQGAEKQMTWSWPAATMAQVQTPTAQAPPAPIQHPPQTQPQGEMPIPAMPATRGSPWDGTVPTPEAAAQQPQMATPGTQNAAEQPLLYPQMYGDFNFNTPVNGGTDVMNLFGSFIPGMDDMFDYSGVGGGWSIMQGL